MAGWSKGIEDTLSGKQAAKKERGALSVEQKLELSHMLRQEQDYNRMQMDQREMLVYGAKSRNRIGRKEHIKMSGQEAATAEHPCCRRQRRRRRKRR